MKILYFTKYSRKGASSRLRSFQYFPYLQERGFEIKVQPLFSDTYLNKKYSGKSVHLEVVKAYSKRFFSLFKTKSVDCVFIEYELFPYFPPIFEIIFKWLGVKMIIDYDDAIFHNYDLNPNPLIRCLLGKKIDRVMKNSDLVLVGNKYLFTKADRVGAKNVILLPTVVDSHRYNLVERKVKKEIVIGWIGSPSTVHFLKKIEDSLVTLSEKYRVKLLIVGAEISLNPMISCEFRDWDEATEVTSINNMDIGIMPLFDTPWTRGKCGYKLIQYMACGLPVVASPVGVNSEIVDHGQNGFLADTLEEWIEFLERLITDEQKRLEMGLWGRKIMEENYSLERGLEILVAALNQLKEK